MKLSDFNINTPLARRGAVIEEIGDRCPETGKLINSRARVKRQSVVARYYAQGRITKRQANAAEAVFEAHGVREAVGGGSLVNERVDVSRKGDDGVARRIDQTMSYLKIEELAAGYAPYVRHVVVDDRFITSMAGYRPKIYMKRLRLGLDLIADAMLFGGEPEKPE